MLKRARPARRTRTTTDRAGRARTKKMIYYGTVRLHEVEVPGKRRSITLIMLMHDRCKFNPICVNIMLHYRAPGLWSRASWRSYLQPAAMGPLWVGGWVPSLRPFGLVLVSFIVRNSISKQASIRIVCIVSCLSLLLLVIAFSGPGPATVTLRFRRVGREL